MHTNIYRNNLFQLQIPTDLSSSTICFKLWIYWSNETNCLINEESNASFAPMHTMTMSGLSAMTAFSITIKQCLELYPENPRFIISTRYDSCSLEKWRNNRKMHIYILYWLRVYPCPPIVQTIPPSVVCRVEPMLCNWIAK